MTLKIWKKKQSLVTSSQVLWWKTNCSMNPSWWKRWSFKAHTLSLISLAVFRHNLQVKPGELGVYPVLPSFIHVQRSGRFTEQRCSWSNKHQLILHIFQVRVGTAAEAERNLLTLLRRSHNFLYDTQTLAHITTNTLDILVMSPVFSPGEIGFLCFFHVWVFRVLDTSSTPSPAPPLVNPAGDPLPGGEEERVHR